MPTIIMAVAIMLVRHHNHVHAYAVTHHIFEAVSSGGSMQGSFKLKMKPPIGLCLRDLINQLTELLRNAELQKMLISQSACYCAWALKPLFLFLDPPHD